RGAAAAKVRFIPVSLANSAEAVLHKDGWADASLTAIQQEQIRVQILSAGFETIELRPEKPELAGKKFLVVRLKLQQTGAARGLEYHHWGPNSPWPAKPTPLLQDAKGTQVRPLSFEDKTLIHGQQIKKELYASALVPDFLVFDVAPVKGTSYRLTLPAYAW